MGITKRACAAALFALAAGLVQVHAEDMVRALHPEATRPRAEAPRPCLNQKERRALVESGTVIRLAAAVHGVRNHFSGALVRARLCHRGDGFAYVLTVLAHDGKVTRVVVDAVKGSLVGER